jgi:pilus assembly protein FimV
MTTAPRLSRLSLLGALTLSSLLLANSALAVGLGKLHSNTRLGYPLQAEIPIHTDGALLTADELKASLLNEQEAAKKGVELLTPRHQFTLDVEERDKQLVLVITSAVPITEPVLNWMIRLDWPKGSLAREYTLMLDI